MVVCLVYVCYSLVCLSIQIQCRHLAEQSVEITSASTATLTTTATEGSEGGKNTKGAGRVFDLLQIKRLNGTNYLKIADTIEKVSFYAYPISFVMFVIIYWLVSLSLGGRNPFNSNYEPTKPGVVTIGLH